MSFTSPLSYFSLLTYFLTVQLPRVQTLITIIFTKVIEFLRVIMEPCVQQVTARDTLSPRYWRMSFARNNEKKPLTRAVILKWNFLAL